MYLDLVQRAVLAQRMISLETVELTNSASYLREGGQDAAVMDASTRLIEAGADAVVVATSPPHVLPLRVAGPLGQRIRDRPA